MTNMAVSRRVSLQASVTGTTAVGGLVGLCGSGMIESCYWDTASSGQATTASVKGVPRRK